MEEDFNKPYDNYFLYSNKRWIEENKVPDSLDYYSLGSYLDEITEKNLMVAIRKISSDPSKRDHYQDLLYKYFVSSDKGWLVRLIGMVLYFYGHSTLLSIDNIAKIHF